MIYSTFGAPICSVNLCIHRELRTTPYRGMSVVERILILEEWIWLRCHYKGKNAASLRNNEMRRGAGVEGKQTCKYG